MQLLLDELYKTDIYIEKYNFRKAYLGSTSYQINGISQSGKTTLVKNYLLDLKKTSYLYIDCNDIRINIQELNMIISIFCNKNKIDTLVLDNFVKEIKIPNVSQLIICCEKFIPIDFLERLCIYPLDYEEFLAYEHKYDSTALNHFFQLGGLPSQHKINASNRTAYIQKTLKLALSDMELDILMYCAKMMAQKVSPFSIYERLKQNRKISKDKLYICYEDLHTKNYIHLLEKFNHKKATKKVYLCDTALKSALSTDKHFGRLFENMVFLELLKSDIECFYDDGIDFYLPQKNEIILCKAFIDERQLFKKLESIEAFIFTHEIKKVTAITMNMESNFSHPFSKVEMIPFDIWAIGD
jgi:predicted AAA+ superfamily ATPase